MTRHRTQKLESSDRPDRTSRRDRPDRRSRRRALVGGEDDCAHPLDERTYLGQMGAAAFYRCAVCDGALVEWSRVE